MSFDKWFEEQNIVLKVILIILPFVGWIMEILIRVSVFLEKKNNVDLLLLILFILLGWTWIPLVIDLVFLLTKGHIFLASDIDDLNKEEKKEEVDAEKKEEKDE